MAAIPTRTDPVDMGLRAPRAMVPVLVMAVMVLATSSSASASGTTWTTHGPEGADIAAFASDTVSGVVYAGGGQTVWSSSDGGADWAKAGTTQADVGWLAADPA